MQWSWTDLMSAPQEIVDEIIRILNAKLKAEEEAAERQMLEDLLRQ